MSQSLAPIAPVGVYLITPDTSDTPYLLKTTHAALSVGVKWLQYRNKSASVELRLEQARALRALTHQHGARLIVNDEVALAAQVRADGVHLGRDDGAVEAARADLGAEAVIGVSAYDDSARAQAAWLDGASYVAFGAVFESKVKPQAVRAPLTRLSQARRNGMHVVAIGGIRLENIALVGAAGAHAAALICAVYDAPDPGAAAQQLLAEFIRGAKDFS